MISVALLLDPGLGLALSECKQWWSSLLSITNLDGYIQFCQHDFLLMLVILIICIAVSSL